MAEIETSADLEILLDPEVFGTRVRYMAEGRPTRAVVGIFTAAHAVLARGEAIGVSSLAPVLTVAAAHFGTDPPASGDRLEAEGTTYVVSDPQPDGSGLIRLVLERE
jgi:hypothetical protein